MSIVRSVFPSIDLADIQHFPKKRHQIMTSAEPVIFVTGTDTDVGKTFVSSLLALKWHTNYWKPIQTGLESDPGDSQTVSNFFAKQDAHEWHPAIFKPVVELQKPLCPLDAVKCDLTSSEVSLKDFVLPNDAVIDESVTPLIIEGAGGIFVPLNSKCEITSDLIKRIIELTDRPVYIVIVARSGLGTLNHTLLTHDHLKNNGLEKHFLGCILNGPKNSLNKETLELYDVKVIAEIPFLDEPSQLDSVLDFIPSLSDIINES